jgi:hypothetical protein
MREQSIFLVSEVQHFRRLRAAFVSAEPRLNIHRNNGRKFAREKQGCEAVNFLFLATRSGAVLSEIQKRPTRCD